MKNIALMGAAVALALSSITAHAADKKTLAFVVNGASDFWKAAEAGVKKAQASCPTTMLQFKYPEQSSAAIQQRLMDDLVAAGVRGIMVCAVDPKTSTDALNKIASADPALHHRQRRAEDQAASPISARRNVDAGKQAGEIAQEGAARTAASAWASSACSAPTTPRSASRASRTRSRAPRSSSSTCAPTTSTRPAPSSNVEDALTANPEVTCMVGFYSYNTPRIYEALKEAGKLGKITVVGFDDDPITLGGVKEGTIAGTVVQQPFEWGYQGMKLMAKYLEGDKSGIPADSLIIIPTKIIDKADVDAYAEPNLQGMQGK